MATSDETGGRRYRQRHFCGHCDEYLPKSTFYRHRKSFFNPVSHEWLRKGDVTAGKSTPRDHQSGDIVFVESSDRLQDGSPGPESESEAATASQPEGIAACCVLLGIFVIIHV